MEPLGDVISCVQITERVLFTFRESSSSLSIIFISAAVFALAIPDLGDLISLIGAVASSALALLFPALLEILTFWPDRGQRKFLWVLPWPVWVVKDCLILLLGIAGLVLGSYASIANIIVNIGDKDPPCHSIYRH